MTPLLEAVTLYIDNCGDSGWNPPFGKSNINWYVCAGVMLTTDADLKAREGISGLLKKYVPPEQKSKRPSKFYEIHYHDIIRGKNLFDHMDHPQRKALSDEIFSLLVGLRPVLFATVVNKLRLKQRYGNRAFSPRGYSLRATIHRYSMYLDHHSIAGSIVVDSEEYRKDTELREMIHDFRTNGIILRSWDYNPMYENTLKSILNTVNYTPSYQSPGIHLSDVVSRSTWAHNEHAKSDRINQLVGLWNDPSRQAYDPSVVPK